MEFENIFASFRQQSFLVSLIYLPQHLFLLVFLPSEIRYYRCHPVRREEHTTAELLILSTKGVLNGLLIVFVISNIGRPETPLAARFLETLSYFIALMLLLSGEKYNVRDQTFLLSFWTLELLINSIRIVQHPTLGSTIYVGVLLALVALLVHSSFTKEYHCKTKICPNLIRSIYFSWFGEVNRTIHQSHLDKLADLEDQFKSARLLRNFRGGAVRKGQYESVTVGEPVTQVAEITMSGLLKPFKHDLILTGVNRFVLTILFFVCPFLLRQILQSDRQVTSAENHFYVISIFVVSLVIAALNGQYMYDTQKIGLKIKSILMLLVYEKSLKLKNSINADVTLLTLDSSRFVDLLPNLHLLFWSGPLIIVISIAGLLAVLGVSALIGVFVMVATIYLTKKTTDKLQILQKDVMARKDPRIASTNEALGMMKQIKYFCWELFFQRRIHHYRLLELKTLRKIIYWDAPKYLLGVISPFLVSLASFTLMILIGDANRLTLESVFVSIALFNILKYPLSVLPSISSHWTTTKASVDRINEFLIAQEIQPLPKQKQMSKVAGRSRNISETSEELLAVCRRALAASVISIQKASFHLEGNPILQDIDLQVMQESFVAVTGSVGSGKSSLLAAILGELDQNGGSSKVVGQIAYVSQEPWILHRTIKDNILFGQEFNQGLYDKVIEACALLPDFKSLLNGDSTLIGEKGITISGGQKQRITLARAVYQNAELYLLDDPLSSVDDEVSNYICKTLFGNEGLLVDKTVVLVAQNHEHFCDARLVVLMENGQISERHSYENYLEKYHKGENKYESKGGNESMEQTKNPSEAQPAFDKKPETVISGKVSAKIYLKYFEMLGWFSAATILLLNIVIPICDIWSTIWLSKWSTINHTDLLQTDHFYLGIYSLFILGLAVFLTINSTLTTVRGVGVAQKVHTKLLYNTIHQQMAFFDKTSSGEIMNRFSNDLDVVDSKISMHFRDFLTNLSSVVSILFLFCFNTSFYIVIILVVIVIIYYYLLVYHLETSRQLKRLEARSRSPLILHFNESREGRSTIRAFRQEEQFLNDFMTILDRHQCYSYLYLASNRWLSIRLEIIGAVIIYFVAMLAVQNQESIGASNVGVSISYALRLIPLLNALVRMTALLEDNATSLERIDQYLNNKNELQLDKWQCNTVTKSWPTQGKIEFQNFSMEYGDRNIALKDITVVINAQEKIGIVGRTGAGKSSLISALFRLYPLQTNGAILIDGVNIDQIPVGRLRKSITIIPQNPLLFSGTLRENLDPCDTLNDSDLWSALERCKLKQLVANFPNQLDTVIDERGSNLSVGQKQLLCLARGILQNAKVVILDEATSTMDAETEAIIQQVFDSTFRNCTVLTVAHRMNTIKQVDRVLSMQQGRVVKLE